MSPESLAESRSALEILRKSFKPDKIKVLLVGEAPPSNGTFFYKRDSNLFRYTKEAFSQALGLRFRSDADFLVLFRDRGFFVDDLRLQPIDRDQRVAQRQAAVDSFAARMQEHNPLYVVVIMKAIEEYVQQAVSVSVIRARRIWVIPFPSHGNQRRYVRELVNILSDLMPDIEATT